MDNFNVLVSGGDQDEDLVHDGWTDIMRNLTGTAAKTAGRKLGRRLSKEERAHLMEMSDYRKMNQVRARVDEIVKEAVKAADLGVEQGKQLGAHFLAAVVGDSVARQIQIVRYQILLA